MNRIMAGHAALGTAATLAALFVTSTCGNCVIVPDSSGHVFISGTSIGAGAFSECTNLVSVAFSSTVISVGQYSFAFTRNLETVTLPSSLIVIGSNAFTNSGVRSVAIPNSVTEISSGAFSFCRRLTSVTLGSSVRTIQSTAFIWCTELTSIAFGPSLQYIADYAFSKCRKLPVNLTAASALTYIGPYAFSEAGSEAALTSHFVIGNQVTAISEKAFEAASTVTAVTIGNSVTIIFPSAFERCVNLTTVEFGRAVRVIGDLSFSQTNLVTISLTAFSVVGTAFSFCPQLTSVNISNNTALAVGAFHACPLLTSALIRENVRMVTSSDVAGLPTFPSAPVTVAILPPGASPLAGIDRAFSQVGCDSVMFRPNRELRNCTFVNFTCPTNFRANLATGICDDLLALLKGDEDKSNTEKVLLVALPVAFGVALITLCVTWDRRSAWYALLHAGDFVTDALFWHIQLNGTRFELQYGDKSDTVVTACLVFVVLAGVITLVRLFVMCGREAILYAQSAVCTLFFEDVPMLAFQIIFWQAVGFDTHDVINYATVVFTCMSIWSAFYMCCMGFSQDTTEIEHKRDSSRTNDRNFQINSSFDVSIKI